MFKYMKKEYADRLLVMGQLRIGTLHDYRSTEHKSGIADVDEGKKIVSHHIKGLNVVDSETPENAENIDFRALSEFNAVAMRNCKNVVFQNVGLRRNIDSPNFFVFCTSTALSKTTMYEFEGADACLEIFDSANFYSLLTIALNRITPVRFLGVQKVAYKNRTEDWNGVDWGTHPALIKHPDYFSQSEIRAMWVPLHDRVIHPVITGHWRLGEFCRLIHI